MGYFKDLKTVMRIVIDCMRNIHPIYNIKELMIKKELAKNPEMASENWDRFLPHFKKQNIKRKKIKSERKKKEYSPFPPEQMLRKEDLAMFSGEYFLTEKVKQEQQNERKRDQKAQRKAAKIEEKNRQFVAPDEDEKPSTKPVASGHSKPDINELKNKFLKKK